MHSATHQAIDAVWRIESAKIVAVVARMVRDIGVAEELAQDALVAALETLAGEGRPATTPAAWLMTTAKQPRTGPAAARQVAGREAGADRP